MTAVTPVSPDIATPLPAAQSVPGQNTLTAEQRLLDYILRFQAEGLASGQQLGNPAALSGEALKSLKSYFERANGLQENAARKVRAMSNGEGIAAQGDVQLPALPGGPAREVLEPAIRRNEAVGEKVAGITDAELTNAVDALMRVLQYGMETAMVTTATNNISKSATTLTRGQ